MMATRARSKAGSTAKGDRDAKGQFRKGNPGGPGRRVGSRNRATEAIEALLAGEAEAVARALVGKAIDGDVAACRAILDRVAPIRRGRPIELDLPPVAGAGDVVGALAAIVDAMAAAAITPTEASELVGVIDAQCKAIELLEIERRLDRVEKASGVRS